MSGDWLAVFEALKDVYQNEAFSNIAINEASERHNGCSTGFVRMFAKGVIRDTILLDSIIDRLADRGLKGIKLRTLIVLRMGIYAIRSMGSVPDYAAVNTAVSLARNVSKGSDRFVNGMLRAFIRKRPDKDIDDSDLCLRYSFPEAIIDLLSSQYGAEASDIIKALYEPAPLVLRANRTKVSREDLLSLLAEEDIEASALPETESGIICDRGSIVNTDLFRRGLFSVQSLSSIIAIEHFAPKPGSTVLDMCAAPGGKTAAMAELMNDSGSILACDVYPHRLELIEASCRRLGLTSVTTGLYDGTVFDDMKAGSFDFVLADVPCSGLGAIQGKPELKLRTDVSAYDELCDIQKQILRNALRYAKPGGLIEYSTCTLNRNENEAIVEAVLNEIGFAQVVEKQTLLPYNNRIGFFYAIISKKS